MEEIMVFKIDEEKYRRSLDYEVLQECITCEMACRNRLRYEVGKDTEQGRIHFDAMTALIKLEKSIDIDDENTVKAAWSTLRVMRAERKAVAASTQPAAIAS
jgi:hypothetical protein